MSWPDSPNRRSTTQTWPQLCRICLEWLHPTGLDFERWVDRMVDRAADLNIDTLAFDIYHGGYAVFGSSISEKDRHVRDVDLFELLDKAVHDRGMRLVAMNMGGHCSPYIASEHPTWTARDPNGEQTLVFEQTPLLCLNSPYLGHLKQDLTILVTNYSIDGLYIEGLYGLDCYCDYCKAEYLATYGTALPVQPHQGEDLENYRRFRSRLITNVVRQIRALLDQHSPDTAFMPCPSVLYNTYADLASWEPYADAVTLERPWGYERTGGIGVAPPIKPLEIGMGIQIARSESRRPVIGTVWHAWAVDHDYTASTPAHYRLNAGEVLLHGGTPQLHAQTVFDLHETGTETVRETFRFVEELRPSMLDTRPLPFAGIVLDWTEFVPTEHFRGFYQALQEAHVPFDVVSRRDLLEGALADFRVAVVPNVVQLSDEEIAALHGFRDSGGGLVLTYRSGLRRPDGTLREEMPFAEVAGIAGPYGILTRPPAEDWGFQDRPYPSGAAAALLRLQYYRVIGDHEIGATLGGTLQSFHGSLLEVETTTGQSVAEALDYDYGKMHRHHPVTGWYPNLNAPLSPLAVANEGAGGRCVYIAAELDRAAWLAGLPATFQLLTEATTWAARARPPIEVIAPPTVASAVHVDSAGARSTVMLLNRTTADLGDPDPVVRYVHPVSDIRIVVRDTAGNTVDARSVSQVEIATEAQGDDCVITLSELRGYDGIVIERR